MALFRTCAGFWFTTVAGAPEAGATEVVPAGVTTTLTNVGSLAPSKVTRPMYEPTASPVQLSVSLAALPLVSFSGFGERVALPTLAPSTAASTEALRALPSGLEYRFA